MNILLIFSSTFIFTGQIAYNLELHENASSSGRLIDLNTYPQEISNFIPHPHSWLIRKRRTPTLYETHREMMERIFASKSEHPWPEIRDALSDEQSIKRLEFCFDFVKKYIGTGHYTCLPYPLPITNHRAKVMCNQVSQPADILYCACGPIGNEKWELFSAVKHSDTEYFRVHIDRKNSDFEIVDYVKMQS